MSARVNDSLRIASKLERLWADDRFHQGRAGRTRDFINAWLITRYSIADHDEAFRETLRRIGADRKYGWWSIVGEDAPRFHGGSFGGTRCPVPKTRGPKSGEACGKYGSTSFRVTDPATGEWTIQGWCSRHEEHARIMRARERSLTNIPEPMPNTGGLLPSYISASNWPDLYVWANSRWTPPYVGIVADDWPVMGKVAKAPLMKVALTALDGGRESQPTTATPALRLVTS